MQAPTDPAGPTASHDYGSPIFAAWRRAAAAEWSAYTDHAFVRGLADGTLPRALFLHYLRQDYVFLIHFSRAWGLAVAKSARLDEMRPAAAIVDALLNHEMDLHVRTCAAAGIAEADLVAEPEAPENLAYTRFVLDAGYSGDFLDLIAALAPCVLGYGEIGARLSAELGDDARDAPYGDWIGTYGGREYQEVCAVMGGLIETAAAARIGPEPSASPRWATLSETFRKAAALEVGFWNMSLRGAP